MTELSNPHDRFFIEDVAVLQALQDALETVSSPPELRRIYQRTN